MGEICRLLYLVTGRRWTEAELKRAGERINNLMKLFNVKHGWKREDDYPPWRAFNEYLKDRPILREIRKEHEAIIAAEKSWHGTDSLSKSKFDPNGAIIRRDEYDEALQSYYDSRGWDKRGIPTKKKLEELGL
jgi:aldehyde:ferredoxin oxidoreductase